MRIVKHPSTKVLTSPIIRNPIIGTAAITAGTVASSVIDECTIGTPALSAGTVDQSVLANCTVGTPAITGGTISAALVSCQPLRLGKGATLTIDGDGEITVTHSLHEVETLGGTATTDDLDTINGGAVGDILVLSAYNSAHTVVVKNVGGLRIGADFSMDNGVDKIILIKMAAGWAGLSTSNNL